MDKERFRAFRRPPPACEASRQQKAPGNAAYESLCALLSTRAKLRTRHPIEEWGGAFSVGDIDGEQVYIRGEIHAELAEVRVQIARKALIESKVVKGEDIQKQMQDHWPHSYPPKFELVHDSVRLEEAPTFATRREQQAAAPKGKGRGRGSRG